MIIMLAGPIKAWWDDNWNTPEHWFYALWRERVNTELVKSYYLVYRPHEAFQGSWDERAQSINDFVLRTCDVVLNLTPPGVPSLGTDGEVLYAENFGKTIIDVPPPASVDDFERALIEMNQKLTDMEFNIKSVDQRPILASLAVQDVDVETLQKFMWNWAEKEKRFHYYDKENHIDIVEGKYLPGGIVSEDLVKVEVLK
jgi:hypothetical protein